MENSQYPSKNFSSPIPWRQLSALSLNETNQCFVMNSPELNLTDETSRTFYSGQKPTRMVSELSSPSFDIFGRELTDIYAFNEFLLNNDTEETSTQNSSNSDRNEEQRPNKENSDPSYSTITPLKRRTTNLRFSDRNPNSVSRSPLVDITPKIPRKKNSPQLTDSKIDVSIFF